jgi:hypothetical protein
MIHTTFSPTADSLRETRTPVRLPDQRPTELFPGWGPKF